jgi:hypothetical protein
MSLYTKDDTTITCSFAQLHALGSDFPIEEAVKVGLEEKDFYENPDACRYLLWNYEEYLATKAGSGATFDEHDRSAIWRERASDSIEHIFPQTPGVGWETKMQNPQTGEELTLAHHVSRIGNLILLPIVLNSEAKALPFGQRKLIYAKHNLRMVHEVVAQDDWGYDMIVARESDLLGWAKVRWADI